MLLALLVFGVCARNLDPDRRLIDIRFGHAARLFFVVLFVLTGATLRPEQFGSIAWLGLAFVLVRLVGKAFALFVLARPAHISARQAATLSLTLTPMARPHHRPHAADLRHLARSSARTWPAVIASGIAILSVLGPIATRYALIESGEGAPEARDLMNDPHARFARCPRGEHQSLGSARRDWTKRPPARSRSAGLT